MCQSRIIHFHILSSLQWRPTRKRSRSHPVPPLYINDISDHFDQAITAQLFADDLKIYTEFSLHTSTISFQQHLNLIHAWSLTWQLNIAYTKCNAMQLGALFTPGNPPALHLADHLLPHTIQLTNLGIQIDNQLKFNNHINDITNRANQRSNLIIRCFLSQDSNSLVRAYKTYVRPLLEYNSVV